MFNTLKYAKMLEDVGFSRDQSETSIKILVEVMDDKLATKQDLKDHRIATQQDIQELRIVIQNSKTEIRQEFQEFKTEVKQDLFALEQKLSKTELNLTVRMGTMFAASIAIITAIQKLL